VELNEKYLFISVKDQQEGSLLDAEISLYNREAELDSAVFAPAYEASQTIKKGMIGGEGGVEENNDLKMTLWETRKLNEHHQSLLREQIWQQKNIDVQNYRQEKEAYV